MSTTATIASHRPDVADSFARIGRRHRGPWSSEPRQLAVPTRDARIATAASWGAAIALGVALLPVAVAAAVVLMPCAFLALLTGPVALAGLATSGRSVGAPDRNRRGLPSLVDLLPDLAAHRAGTTGAVASPPFR